MLVCDDIKGLSVLTPTTEMAITADNVLDAYAMSKMIGEHGGRSQAMVPNDTRRVCRRGWDRCTRWLAITIPLHVVAFASLPYYGCGCCFHFQVLIPTMPPAFWGFYVFARYRAWDEGILAWISVVLSVFWLFLAWEGSVKFFFLYGH